MNLLSHRPSHRRIIFPAIWGVRGLRVVVSLLLMLALPSSGMASTGMAYCQHSSESSSHAAHHHGAGTEHGAAASVATDQFVDARHAGPMHQREHSECKCHCPCSGPCASACMLAYAMPTEAHTVLPRFLPDFTSAANQRELSDAHSRNPFRPPILPIA